VWVHEGVHVGGGSRAGPSWKKKGKSSLAVRGDYGERKEWYRGKEGASGLAPTTGRRTAVPRKRIDRGNSGGSRLILRPSF